MDLYKTISVRKSVRKFQMKPFSEELLQQINAYKGYIFPLYRDESYSIQIVSMLEKGTVKLAGFRTDAPYYILFFGSDTKNGRMNAGFLLEKIVLYLADKGIGSCYQGMLSIKKGKEIIPAGQSYLIALACGYPQGELERPSSKAKRLPIEQISVKKETYNWQMRAILEAGRLAPSAINSQPWRLVMQKNRIHVFLKKPDARFPALGKLQEIDTGILLAHFKVTADELWLQMNFEVVGAISEREFKNTTYVVTVFVDHLEE